MNPQGQRVVNLDGARHVFPGDATDDEIRQALGGSTPPVPGMKGMPLPGMPAAPTPTGLKPDTGLMNFYNKPAFGKSPNLKTQSDLNRFEQENPVEKEPGQEDTLRGVGQVLSGKDETNPARSPADVRVGGASHILRGVGKGLAPIAIPAAVAAAPAAALTGLAGGAASGWAGEHIARGIGVPEGTASAIGDVTGLAGGYAGSRIPDALPSTARAGRNFETVMSKAGDQPINVSKVEPIAERARELSTSGATAPKLFTDYWNETVKPEPWTYRRGRDFASNAGRLSVNEGLSTNPQMHRQVGAFAKEMNNANAEAAQNAGVGPEYDSAMTEYRRAKQLEALGGEAKKFAKYAIPATAAGYVGKRLLDERK